VNRQEYWKVCFSHMMFFFTHNQVQQNTSRNHSTSFSFLYLKTKTNYFLLYTTIEKYIHIGNNNLWAHSNHMIYLSTSSMCFIIKIFPNIIF
jgi:hypothetical protein